MSDVDDTRALLLAIPHVEKKLLACCEKCVCFRQVGKTDYGNCHFNPPTMYYDELTCARVSAWPEVHKGNWCNKFEGVYK